MLQGGYNSIYAAPYNVINNWASGVAKDPSASSIPQRNVLPSAENVQMNTCIAQRGNYSKLEQCELWGQSKLEKHCSMSLLHTHCVHPEIQNEESDIC